MNPRQPRVAARAEYRCEYCRAPELVFNFPFEVEHVIPTFHGGTDADDNLALACRACNAHKATGLAHVDPLTGDVVRLFDPRQDRWSDHFRALMDTATIEGITNIGRATVARLAMNAPEQIEARQLWARLSLFP